jgi:hypothetical protein
LLGKNHGPGAETGEKVQDNEKTIDEKAPSGAILYKQVGDQVNKY